MFFYHDLETCPSKLGERRRAIAPPHQLFDECLKDANYFLENKKLVWERALSRIQIIQKKRVLVNKFLGICVEVWQQFTASLKQQIAAKIFYSKKTTNPAISCGVSVLEQRFLIKSQ